MTAIWEWKFTVGSGRRGRRERVGLDANQNQHVNAGHGRIESTKSGNNLIPGRAIQAIQGLVYYL